MQKCTVPMDRTQRVHEKNGSIFIVIVFTVTVMIINISKMNHYYSPFY